MSIAFAVIKYIVNVIKCRTIFATHFRVLIEEAKLMSGIRNVHMVFNIIF